MHSAISPQSVYFQADSGAWVVECTCGFRAEGITAASVEAGRECAEAIDDLHRSQTHSD